MKTAGIPFGFFSKVAGLVFCLILFASERGFGQGIVINEVLINGPGACDNACMPATEEWIELYNSSCDTVNIGCYRLSDGDFTITIPANTQLLPKAHYLIGTYNSPIGIVAPNLDLTYCNCVSGGLATNAGALDNDNEQLVLYNTAGVIEDAIYWGSGQGVPVNITAGANNGCTSQVLNVPAVSNSAYENIGTSGADGCTMARQEDGSTIWVQMCGSTITPKRSNAPVTSFVNVSATGPCSGPVQLTATGAVSYSWSPAAGLSATVGASVTANPAGVQEYFVTGTDAQGCVSTDSIIVFTSLQVSPTSAQICTGQFYTFSAYGANSFSWSTGDTTATISVSPPATTTYTVYGVGASGCTNSATVTLTVIPSTMPPVVVQAQTATSDVCEGENTVITASGATTYSWYPSTGIVFNNGSQILVNPPSSIVYTVTGTTGQCSATDTIRLTVHPKPSLGISSSVPTNTICVGQNVNLSVFGAASYSWAPSVGLNSSTGNQVTAMPTVTTSYTVTGTNYQGCSNTAALTIVVKPLPNVTASPATATICQGLPISLTGAGAATYVWFTIGNGAVVTTTPAAAGTYTYTVEGTGSNGCKKTANSVITVLPSPNITASASPPGFCIGGSTVLTASGALSYSWTPGATLSATTGVPVTATPTVTTNYTVSGPGSNGCIGRKVVPVTVHQLPPVQAVANPPSVCFGLSQQLTATGAATYSWSTGQTSTTISVSPATATVYTLTGTSAAGCVNSDTIHIAVNPMPALQVSGGIAICEGYGGVISATGANVYSWFPGTGLSDSTASIVTASPTATTLYSVIGFTAQGCPDTATVLVTVNPSPVISVSPDTLICEGQAVLLQAAGNASFSWEPGLGLNTTTGPMVLAQPDTATLYSVIGTNNFGCVDSAAVLVDVFPAIDVQLQAQPSAICIGELSTLSATGAQTYSWFSGQTDSVLVVSPVTSTTYTVVGNTSVCTDTSTVTVTVNPTPQLQVTSSVPGICAGNPVQLSASGAALYSWSTGDTLSAITVFPTDTTTYTVVGLSAFGCPDTASITINVLPSPPVVALGDTSICVGESTTLTATGALSYSWSPATGLSSTTGSLVTAQPVVNTSYVVTGLNQYNCPWTDTVTVLTTTFITVTATAAPPTVCAGDPVTLSAHGATSYSWSTGQTGTVVTAFPTTTTTFTVFGTTATGGTCADTTSTIPVLVNPLPVIGFSPATPIICAGGSITVTASGGVSYSWSTGATTAAVTVSPTVTTPYVVWVTTADGCIAQETITVQVNPIPNITISPGNPAICAGDTLTLSAAGASAFSWINGPAGPMFTVSPANTTTYSVVGNSLGCSDTATVTLTVNPIPQVGISPSFVQLCEGASITLTGFGANTYSWSNMANTPSITVAPPVTTTFTVFGNSLGCADTAYSTVEVTVAPNVLVVPAAPVICAGTPVSLSASGAASYSWSNTGLTNVISVSPVNTTTYTVIGTTQGCPDTATVTVTVNPVPQLTVTATPDAICAGQQSTLSVTGAASYSWSTAQPGPQITVSPQSTTTYSVTGTTAGCESAPAAVTVTVTPIPPPPAVSSNSPVCLGADLILTASTSAVGATFSWTGPNGFTSTFQNPIIPAAGQANAGTYSVFASVNGCESAPALTVVNLAQVPVVQVSPDSAQLCFGATVTLNANGALTYSWSPATGLSASTGATVQATPLGTTTYTVTGSNGSCSSTATVTLDVLTGAIANAGPDQLDFCGLSTTLQGNLPVQASGTWTILSGVGGSLSNPGLPNATFSGQAGVVYQLRWTISSQACGASIDEVLISFVPVADTTGVEDQTRCGPGTVTFTGPAIPGAEYHWYPDPAGPFIATGSSFTTPVLSVSTTYYVTISAGGCSSVRFPVQAFVLPEPAANAGPGQTIQEGQGAYLSGSGGTIYSWMPTFSLSNPVSATPLATPQTTTTYTLFVTNPEGCSTSDTVTIKVLNKIVVPNGFTPNGDGINDVWEMPVLTEQYPDCQIEVFNRWGGLVYESRGYPVPWDGRVNGELLPPSTYYYVIRPKQNVNVLAGSVTILQ